jgi:hypothetical protein
MQALEVSIYNITSNYVEIIKYYSNKTCYLNKGIRMLDGPITDSLEAKSLSYNRDHIDIYSASWGPTDNGEQLDGPDSLAEQALKDGVKYVYINFLI